MCLGGREPSLPARKPRLSYVSIDIETTGLDETKCQTLEIGAVLDDWTKPIAELPIFRRIVAWDQVVGTPYAMSLNAGLLKAIGTRANEKPTAPEDALIQLVKQTGSKDIPVNRILNHLRSPISWHDIPNFLLKCPDLHPEVLKFAANPPMPCCFCKDHQLANLFSIWLKANGVDPKHIQAAGKNFAAFDMQFLKRMPVFEDLIAFRHRIIDPAILYWEPDDEKLPDSKTCYERAGYDSKVAHTAVEDAQAIVWLVRQGVKRLG